MCIHNDIMIRGLLADKSVKLIAIDAKAICECARKTHGLSRVCTAALGRALMVTCMMGAQLKGEGDKLTTIVKGEGPAGNIVCCARPDGTVKGYIENPKLELPLGPDGKLDVSMAVGWFGELTVIRDMHMKEPYVGRCSMVSGEIAEDFAQYFTVSEQQPSLVYLGVRVAPVSGEVIAAGGLILQPMPQCPDEVITRLTNAAEGIKLLSGMLEELTLEDSLGKLLSGMDMEIVQRTEPRFECDCSRARLEQVLISMGENELCDMIQKDHGAQLTCQFCNSKYDFNEMELSSLLSEAKTGDN
ncbi:MAG: Hsp33 family molecular chaperone HslO [Clostridia bacterium]